MMRILIFSLIAIGLVSLVIGGLFIDGNSFEGGEVVEIDVKESFDPELVKSIEINTASMDVNIVPYYIFSSIVDPMSVRMHGTGSSDIEMKTSLVDGKLIVEIDRPWRFGFFNEDLVLDVIINPELLEEINVNTASGDLDAKVSIESFEINTASGDADLLGKYGTVDVNTASGDLKLVGSAEDLEANTASGDVYLEYSTMGNIEMTTASGNAVIKLPADAGFSLEYDTASGDVTNNFPTVTSGNTMTVGSGEYSVKVDTASGDLDLLIN